MEATSGPWVRIWDRSRRLPLATIALTLTCLAALGLPAQAPAADGPQSGVAKIGIVGAGKMGSSLAQLWSKAGYQVMISSRHPDQLQPLLQSMGANARAGTAQEAAAFGDVIVVSVPYGAEPQLGQELAPQLTNKVVIDLGNPYPARDGQMAVEARQEGTGVASARFFPGARLVRAFNAINFMDLRKDAHRSGEPVAIPIASNDQRAIRIVSRLVRAAGFAPVVVGPLSTAKRFDVGSSVYVKPMSAAQLRSALGLPAH